MAEPTAAQILTAFRAPQLLRDHLVSRFYEAKLAAYRTVLSELRVRFGGPARVYLSTAIRDALLAEAERDVASVLRTYEGFAAGEVSRAQERGLSGSALAAHMADYMRERGRNRAALIARSEVVAPRLDATVSFYRENGIEPEFDFAGPPPKCAICKALIESGPYHIDSVLAIGIPHIQCRHHWSAREVTAEDLLAGGLRPGQISAGRGGTAGLVGGTTLHEKIGGNAEQIAERIREGIFTRSHERTSA